MDREAGTRSPVPRAPPGRRQALHPEQRYRFLADASRELASSLDYEETLAGVAGRPLPFLGAWCIVDLVGEDGHMRRIAIVHPDPEMRRLVDRLRSGWPPSRDDPFGIPTVMRSKEPELVSRIPDELLVKAAQDEENLRILRALRMGSLVSVPMVARGKLIGAITYVAPEAGHGFTDEDVALASDLATLSALAVENARLHEEARTATREARARGSDAERLAALAGTLNERLLLSAIQELEAAEVAEAMEEARSEFTTSLSHELRTPLNAIMGYVELLLDGYQGPLTDEQTASLEPVKSAARHILHLVDQVLSHARIGAKREPMRVERVDVTAVAREALALLEPSAARKHLGLRGEFPADALMVWTDEDKVRQILLNLLSNATKFTDEGEVRLEVVPDGKNVLFRVVDTGRGISREDRTRIFERFRRAEDTVGLPAEGSGLGLAITRALVGLLGGEISMESKPGHGSTFTVSLPSRRRPSRNRRSSERTTGGEEPPPA